MSCQGYRGYISSRMMERSVPQSVQQLVIRDYCQRNGLKFLLSATEYHEGYMMLNALMRDKSIEGIIFYSIFQLPENEKKRTEIYKLHNAYVKPLYFAAENMRLAHFGDIGKMEDIFLLRSIMCNERN